MQNQYVADVGDFAKFGLLRGLAGVHPLATPRLGVGVVWYLTPDSRNNDGRHRSYLLATRHKNRTRFRECDPNLYDALQTISGADRSVLALESAGLLPETTHYFGERVPVGTARDDWAAGASRAVGHCDLVFLDPDNGLAPKSVRVQSRDAVKYVYLDDLRGRIALQQSVVVYQHLGRNGSAAEQAQRHLTALRKAFPGHAAPWAVRFRRGTGRIYLVVPAVQHEVVLRDRRDALLAGEWGRERHFEMTPSC